MLCVLLICNTLLKASSVVLSTEQERDLFLENFCKYLVSGSPKLSADQPGSTDFKATKVCKNLGKVSSATSSYLLILNMMHYVACLTSVVFVGSLSDYAKTLIPNLLNEEDVQLLRCLKPFYDILYCILVSPID